MGTSTDGHICFGILFEEGVEFPWDNEPFGGDITDWWRSVNGFRDVHQPWTPDGDYMPGWSLEDERFNEYIAAQVEWDAENPVPVELVNYCSDSCAMYILAYPDSIETANRGSPIELGGRLETDDCAADRLRAFCGKYLHTEYDDPKWWLSSYWSR